MAGPLTIRPPIEAAADTAERSETKFAGLSTRKLTCLAMDGERSMFGVRPKLSQPSREDPAQLSVECVRSLEPHGSSLATLKLSRTDTFLGGKPLPGQQNRRGVQ
jgi:hypothetical protein